MVHPKYEKNRLICVSLGNHDIVEYSWDGGNYPPSQSTNKSLTLGNVEDYYRRSTFYYVSDLHLDYKLAMKYPQGFDKNTLSEYLDGCVDRILPPKTTSIEQSIEFGSYVMLCGDISGDVETGMLFLRKFANRVKEHHGNLIFVLGNHELWFTINGAWNPEDLTVEEIVDRYREFCQSHEVIFLHNDILLLTGMDQHIIDKSVAMNLSDRQLMELCKTADMIVLGGTGFSSKNKSFNATHGIYRRTIRTLEEDELNRRQFIDIYGKLYSALSTDSRIIVMTHNPPRDWIDGSPNPDWVYFHGHSHSDEFEYSDERKIFADNQWGYKHYKDGLKKYDIRFKHDIYEHYHDGIYRISKNDYLNFNIHLGINCSFKNDGEILMLKREGFYVFLFKGSDGKLKLMEGGKLHPLDNLSVEKIYAGMVYVASVTLEKTSNYREYIKKVSDFVKNMGGEGRIHGTIVDLDYFNHLYINLYDGTVTSYYAKDMVHKIVYPDLKSLLQARMPHLLGPLERVSGTESGNVPIKYNPMVLADPEGTPYLETDIYRISNKMRRLQYTADHNIIRNWIPRVEYDDLNDEEIPHITDTSGNLDGCPALKPALVLSDESDYCVHVIASRLENSILGPVTEDDVRNLIADVCNTLSNHYRCDDPDLLVTKLLPKITGILRDHGKTVLDNHSEKGKTMTSENGYSWKEQIDELILLEVDFADCLIDYLENTDEDDLKDRLKLDLKGNRKNDLKKVFRKLFVSKHTTMIYADENGVARTSKIDTKYIDSYIEDYLAGARSTSPKINPKPDTMGNIIDRRLLIPANDASYAAEGIGNINCIVKLDWYPEAVRSIIMSVLESDPACAQNKGMAAAFVYSKDSAFASGLVDRLDRPWFTSEIWDVLVSDDSAMTFLMSCAQIFECEQPQSN